MVSSVRGRPSNTANRQSRGPAPPPVYQPPSHPLDESAQCALQNLPREHKLDSLKHRLRAANNHLTHAAADVNERLQLRNTHYEKLKKRLEKQGSQDDEQYQMIVNARKEADDMTGKLEEHVRRTIDSGAEVENIERALRELQENVADGRGRFIQTQSTLGESHSGSTQNRRRQRVDSDDEENEFEDDTTQPIGENDSAIGVLKRRIADQRSEYEVMSMADRYSQHNDYVGFKKIVHDARYPEDQAPPLPHSSTWFPKESPDPTNPSSRSAEATPNEAIEDDDEDLVVEAERISIKCPLTLLPMKVPVTSQKCKHSFEKEAILSMINASEVSVGGSGRRGVQDGKKAMKCPVCSELLTADDVKEDPVLVRKIKRIQDAQNAQYEELSEEEEDDDDKREKPTLFGGSRRPEEITSSPIPTKIMRMKSEKRSVAPSRQSRQVSMVPNSQG